MDDFTSYIFREEYSKVQALGDTLSNISNSLDWEPFRGIISTLYSNNREDGGRPHFDEVLMVKIVVLQQLYGLSDYDTERHIYDRVSFRHFLDYPEVVPDRSTIWFFRERLKTEDSLDRIWVELQCQLDNLGYEII